MNSVKGTIGSLLGKKEMTTGERFKAGLKESSKSKISFLTTSLERSFEFFDFIAKRNSLLVYFEPNGVNKAELEIKLLHDFGEEIEKNFAFIGVNGSSNEISLLEGVLRQKDVPAVIAYGFDELGRFSMIGSLELNGENSKDRKLIGEFLKTMAKIADATDTKFEESYKSLRKKLHGGHHEQGNYDPYEDPNGDERYPGRYIEKEADEDLEMRKQMSSDRRMKRSQDQAYEETLKKIEVEKQKRVEGERVAAMEAEKQKKQEQEILEMKRKFENEKVDANHLIQISLRLPNGQRVMRDFDLRSKVGYVMDYVRTFEEKGFEHPKAEFSLGAGFPPKTLDPNNTLQEVFGNSENEMVHVKEI